MLSLQPTTTGSATAIALIYPDLKGKLDGHAVRAPVLNASPTACVFELKRVTSADEVNALFRAAAGGSLAGILGYEARPLVSADYCNDSRSAIVDGLSTLVTDGTLHVDDAVFVQVATPSRERVDQYRLLRDDRDRLVGRINGDVGRIGQQPVTYLHASYPREEMAALYRAADVMVVPPLRDGMNLGAKASGACRYDAQGARVLSEFAGAAAELRQAYRVDPYDINGMKSALMDAICATPRENGRRMKAMRKQVREHDIEAWATAFLDDLASVRGTHDKKPRPAQA